MWGICLDGKAWEDGLFQAVVQYKIDNSKALVMSPKANYELDIKKCLQHFMKNLRFFLNLRPSDEGLSYMVKKCLRHFNLFPSGEGISYKVKKNPAGRILRLRRVAAATYSPSAVVRQLLFYHMGNSENFPIWIRVSNVLPGLFMGNRSRLAIIPI